MKKTGTEHPCTGCGRIVAYRTAPQYRANGGKPRVPHKCAHGVPCVFGSPTKGDGCNGPMRAGPYHCPKCWKEWCIKQRDPRMALPALDRFFFG